MFIKIEEKQLKIKRKYNKKARSYQNKRKLILMQKFKDNKHKFTSRKR